MSLFASASLRDRPPFVRSRRLALVATVALAVSACGGGGGGGGPVPTPVSSSTGGGTSTNQSAYTCSNSDTPSARVREAASATRRPVMHGASTVAPYTGLLAVTYSRTYANASRPLMVSRESSAGASFVREFDHAHAGTVTRVIAVPAAARVATEARLRAQPGVLSVGATGARRHAFGAAAYFTSDPYFVGFPSETDSQGTYPQTQGVGPYYEAANVEGQWDMHAIGLERAFGYGIQGNAGAYSANALGSSSVKLAVIDSGQDTNNDDLGAKIVYQRCFITDPSNAQSTSNFTTDQDGHGTVVAAIAGADFNNNLGFVGSGGQTSLYGYRVDPTPTDNCADPTTAANDNQCGSNTLDIASAIEDAIAQHVNVINLSLGADPCTSSGQDSDPTEGAAIADAIAANIVVVAAAGNDAPKTQAVASPACDTGVIAVGASALDDGATNGSAHTGGSAQVPVEYVASYSQFGSPASAYRNTSAWGIVAPGGDATGGGDNDDLHWIENAWTTTPFDSKFAGFCYGDYPNENTAVTVSNNCHVLIAGTSMSSPSVAGAAALIIAANPSYQSPTAMKQLLCSTADDIGQSQNEGCGRLNVYRAMAKALNDPNPP